MPLEYHRLPHLAPFERRPIVFLTVVTWARRPLLACDAAFAILSEIWARSASIDDWVVGRFVLMPDHVHLFAASGLEAKALGHWMQIWKSLSSRRIANALGTEGPVWQKDYFDRFLRSADSYEAKWEYVKSNPVRKGLCAHPVEWPWQGEICELRM